MSHKKLNAGCIRIFRFLKLLYADKAYYKDVTDIFRDEQTDQTNNNIQVSLNKAINALKIFGIKIDKRKGKYKLLSSLYSMNFTLDDIKAMSLLLNSAQQIPDENFALTINEFTEAIEFRMNNEDKNTLNIMTWNSDYDFSFYYKDTKNQISECEKVCNQPFMVKLVYLKNGKEQQMHCTPKEVVYDSKIVLLRVNETAKMQNHDIPLNEILSLQPLPKIYNKSEINTTVVFKLKGRLAKSYKLKENEYTREINEDGSITVINSGEPFDSLIKRFMRYSYNCEVMTPKFLRERMLKTINDTLSNYE